MRKMFSENQIKNIVNESELKPISVEQQEANWSYTVTVFPTFTNGVSSPIFCRIQQINQELHIVMLGKIENPTEETIGTYSTSDLLIELPEKIASKIYDILGNKVSDGIDNMTRVSYNYASATLSDRSDMSKYTNDVCMNILNDTQANKIRILFQRNSQMSIPAGQTLYLESRVSLDLI